MSPTDFLDIQPTLMFKTIFSLDNQIADEGDFLFMEFFQVIDEEGMM